jgi:hypothetical protein
MIGDRKREEGGRKTKQLKVGKGKEGTKIGGRICRGDEDERSNRGEGMSDKLEGDETGHVVWSNIIGLDHRKCLRKCLT